MCGITGFVTRQESGVRDRLIDGLKRLEYRGYDSAGLALADKKNLIVYKTVGKVSELEKAIPAGADAGTGIAHTRWATHGVPSERNAHPHKDCKGRVVVVHNGIIENHDLLRVELESRGHRYQSDTDTETIAHLMEEHLGDDPVTGDSAAAALAATTKRLTGSWAIACLIAGLQETLLATRNEAPLLLGHAPEMGLVASDATALIGHTREVTYLEDGDIVIATPQQAKILDTDLTPQKRKRHTLQWDLEEAQRGGYPHYMLKEIHETPKAVNAAISGRIDLAPPYIRLDSGLEPTLGYLRGVIIVACGTSLYAGMVARHFIETITGMPVEVHNASEYRYSPELRNEPPRLAIALTQSGETADTLAAMREAKRRGHATLAITNIIGSTAARDADGALQVHAGPEIGVAATKSYHAQLAVLYLVGLHLAEANNTLSRSEIQEHARRLERVPRLLQQTLNRAPQIEKAGALLEEATSAFYLGRQQLHPVAMEGALKLKEISYIHAEGYSGGELKHGPFALLTEKTPVVGLLSDDHVHAKMLSNLIETKARGAPLLVLTTDGDDDAKKYADATIHLPRSDPLFSPFPHSLALQLLAYQVAARRGLNIDKPRNLAKSVTVE
jgi:glutamine---fructose-6-phosphate transaminase (isomerizing)